MELKKIFLGITLLLLVVMAVGCAGSKRETKLEATVNPTDDAQPSVAAPTTAAPVVQPKTATQETITVTTGITPEQQKKIDGFKAALVEEFKKPGDSFKVQPTFAYIPAGSGTGFVLGKQNTGTDPIRYKYQVEFLKSYDDGNNPIEGMTTQRVLSWFNLNTFEQPFKLAANEIDYRTLEVVIPAGTPKASYDIWVDLGEEVTPDYWKFEDTKKLVTVKVK